MAPTTRPRIRTHLHVAVVAFEHKRDIKGLLPVIGHAGGQFEAAWGPAKAEMTRTRRVS